MALDSPTSLAVLGGHMRILDSGEVTRAAGACRPRPIATRAVTMPNGKVLVCQTFEADSTREDTGR